MDRMIPKEQFEKHFSALNTADAKAVTGHPLVQRTLRHHGVKAAEYSLVAAYLCQLYDSLHNAKKLQLERGGEEKEGEKLYVEVTLENAIENLKGKGFSVNVDDTIDDEKLIPLVDDFRNAIALWMEKEFGK